MSASVVKQDSAIFSSSHGFFSLCSLIAARRAVHNGSEFNNREAQLPPLFFLFFPAPHPSLFTMSLSAARRSQAEERSLSENQHVVGYPLFFFLPAFPPPSPPPVSTKSKRWDDDNIPPQIPPFFLFFPPFLFASFPFFSFSAPAPSFGQLGDFKRLVMDANETARRPYPAFSPFFWKSSSSPLFFQIFAKG